MGDVAAIFSAHHESLWRFLTRLTGDSDVAADAAQTAFVRYIERPPAPGDVRAWLFRVGRNAALEDVRTRTRRVRLMDAAPGRAPIADPLPAPDASVDTADRARLVRAALARLSTKERTVLLMREEGFTHREIAAAVDTTTGSVGTMVARALDKLAADLRLEEELS